MTPRSDPSHLASGHATETLSPAERRDLYRAALDDQEIFDQLVEEESWRQLFSAPGVRQELLEVLAKPASAAAAGARDGGNTRGGFRTWLAGLRVPPLAMGAAAAALLAVALVPRWLELGVAPGEDSPGAPPAVVEAPPTELVPKSYDPEGGADPRPESATRSLQPKSTGSEPLVREGILNLSYTLELNQPDQPRQVPGTWAFRPGDQFRLRLGVDFTAWLYLFNRAAGDAVYTVLYPHAGEVNPLRPTQRDVLLPAGIWLTMDDTPEDEELVLVASTRPFALAAAGRETVAAGELDAALAQAEKGFAALNWRRSEIGDRVRLTVERPARGGQTRQSEGDLVAVLRLLGEGP